MPGRASRRASRRRGGAPSGQSSERWLNRTPGALVRGLHAAWRAGLVGDDELRASLVLFWCLDGFAEDEALEMLAAVGYVTDAPGISLPDSVDIFRGQARGERLGIAWSLNPERALYHAADHARRVDNRLAPELYSGRVAACDVLLFSCFWREVVVRREAILDLRSGIPPGVFMAPWVPRPTLPQIERMRPGAHLMFRLAGREAEADTYMANLLKSAWRDGVGAGR